MTRSKMLPSALAATLLLAATAAPAFAVSIKHTNRVGGDPEVASAPTGHAAPPVDASRVRAFDKAHENGTTR